MKTTTTVALLAVAAILLAGTPRPVAADLLPIEEATEVMIESQGLHAIFVGLYVGPGAGSSATLNFISTVGEGFFRYELEPASFYLGEPATWSTTGARDALTGIWRWTTTSLIGATDLSSTGEMGPFVGVDPPAIDVLPVPPPFPSKVISDVTYKKNNKGDIVSKGTITITDSLGVEVSKTKQNDSLVTQGKNKGKWRWNTTDPIFTDMIGEGKEFRVLSFGNSPLPDGGLGSFQVQVVPVPEPSSFVLMGLGGAWVVCLARRRRPSAA